MGVVLRARCPLVGNRGRDIDAKLEAPVEGQVELEEARVLIAVVEEIVGIAVGRDAQAIEHAVEGVQPALARGTACAGWWADPRLVPAFREEAAEGQGPPSLGLRIHVAGQRLDDGAEQAVLWRRR